MTGHAHPREVYARGDFPPSANDFPCFGAVDQDLRGEAVRVEAVEPRIGVERLRDRQKLLADLDDQRRKLDSAAAGTLDQFRRRAAGECASSRCH